MKLTYGSAAALKRARILACFIVQDAKIPAVHALYGNGKELAGAVAQAREEGFTGKEGQVWICRPATAAGLPERVILVGCGTRERSTFERVRRASGHLSKRLREFVGGTVDLVTPAAAAGEEDSVRALRAAAEGLLLGAYRFHRHKSKPPAVAGPIEIRLCSAGTVSPARGVAALRRAEVFADATNFARDLVNEPPGHLTPRVLGNAARDLAKGTGLRARVFDKAEIRRMKMGSFLGVNQGSVEPPVFIHLVWKPKGKPRRKVALVGKGITFDSGGLCLKTAEGMLTMKDDMGGAAVVLAVMRALPRLGLPVEVHGIVPATENMTGGNAFKPGDVLTAMNGKTIEVTNTDAEGRLVLADALHYAVGRKPDEIIDYATLTGAIVVALGNSISGVFGRDADQVRRILRAADESGESMWRMPLYEGYRDNLRSQVADLVNSERRDAGAIKAALFLSEFVDHPVWTHIDIAGTAWTDKEQPYGPVGGTGAAVRTTLQYLTSL